MKKYLALGLTLAMAVCAFTGCGKSDETAVKPGTGEAEDKLYDYSDIKDIVKLGQYENLNIEMDIPSEVTDATVEYYITGMLETAAFLKDETKDVVEADSIVNLDYKGMQNGVPFEGGTAENQTIDVAGNKSTAGTTYIEGFTSGLAGTKVGEKTSYEVTFPENYGSSELAGQTVTFEFTINYVCKSLKYEELTDEYAKQLFDVSSVDDLKQQVRTVLESTVESDYEDGVREKIEAKIMETSTVNVPDELVYARIDTYAKSIEEYYGISIEEFSELYAHVTYEEYAVTLGTQARKSMTSEYLFRAIAEDAGLKFDENEYKAYVDKLVANYAANGVTGDVDLYAMMKPSEKESGEEFVKNMYICNKAMDYCMEKANIVKLESK